MSTRGTQPLLYPVDLWSDESVVASYQLRVRAANQLGELAQLFRLAGLRATTSLPTKLLVDLDCLNAIGHIAGLRYDLATVVPRPLLSAAAGKGDTYVLRWHGGELSLQFWMKDSAQVCVSCLREQGYLDGSVDYWHLPVCSTHREVLLDACPANGCGAPLQLDRHTLFHCGACGFDLRRATATAASADACAVAGQLLRLRDTALEAEQGQARLNPSQVGALVAYLASGVRVESIAAQLPPEARLLSSAARYASLVAFSDCFDGQAISAERLRTAVIRRKRYLEPFKETAVFSWWLLCEFGPTDLGIAASNALLHGLADDYAHLAVHQAERLVADSATAAQQVLQVSSYEFDELVKVTGLRIEPGAEGYDSDDLANAAAFVRACMSETAVDRCFGLTGVVDQLLRHKKLTAFAPRATPFVRINPVSLLQFLEGVDRSISGQAADADSEALSSCLGTEEQARAAAQVLMRAGNGSCEPVGWRAPYRLADVLVPCVRRSVPTAEPGLDLGAASP